MKTKEKGAFVFNSAMKPFVLIMTKKLSNAAANEIVKQCNKNVNI
ncbi:hypothetical protein [Bacillus cereus]